MPQKHMTPNYRTETGDRRAYEPPSLDSSYQPQEIYPAHPEYPQEYPLAHQHNMAARGFGQMFGLHPGIAFLIIIADTMIFSGDIISGGLLLPVAFGGAAVLGIITHMAQKSWFGDDDRNALIKALIVALLTAIPSPLPYVLFVPAGLVGFFRRRK
jgi:hypothetical protein